MRVVLTHNTTRAKAKKKLVQLLDHLAREHEGTISDLAHKWEDDVLHFGFRAKGMKAEGKVEVTDLEIILEGKLPLLARPFESRITSTIEREGRRLFQTA